MKLLRIRLLVALCCLLPVAVVAAGTHPLLRQRDRHPRRRQPGRHRAHHACMPRAATSAAASTATSRPATRIATATAWWSISRCSRCCATAAASRGSPRRWPTACASTPATTISCRCRPSTPTPCATAPRASSASSPTTTSCTGTRSAPAGRSRSNAAACVARLPQPVPVERLHAEGYTGAQGAKEQHYTAALPAPGSARWQLTQPLAPQQGFTVVLTFPKGLVTAPTRAQRVLWFLKDNRGVLVALFGLARPARVLPAALARGRARPARRHHHRPLRAAAKAIRRPACATCGAWATTPAASPSDLLALAVDGMVRIHRDKGFLKDKWRLERTGSDGSRTPSESRNACCSATCSPATRRSS